MPKTSRNPRITITNALVERKILSWPELSKITKLSNGTLSKYLKQMMADKKVKCELIKTRKIYSLSDPLQKNEKDSTVRKSYDLAIYMAHLITKIENRDSAKGVFDWQLQVATDSLICNILRGLIQASTDPDDCIILERIRQGEKNEKLSEDISQLWEKCSKTLDVNSIVETIFWLAFKNIDVAFGEPSPITTLLQEKQTLKRTPTDKEVDALEMATEKLSKEP